MRAILRDACMLLCLSALLLLCACGAAQTVDSQPQSGEALCRVLYYDGEKLLREETLTAGETPEAYVPELEGRRFIGWEAKNGEELDPAGRALTEDLSVYARSLPAFGTHEAYLFADERGFLQPEEALDAQALSLALQALACAQEPVLPPEDGQTATLAQIREALQPFFTAQDLSVFDGEGTITRADFAVRMNALLARGGEETLRLKGEARAAVDLSRSDARYFDLLEASVPHEPDADGATWDAAAPGSGYEPGALFLGGELYCCGEDGYLLRDATADTLYFDETGRYSSGDEELDQLVRELLASLCEQFPADQADRMAMLRHVYDYMMSSYRFMGINTHKDDPGWELRDSKVLLESGRGDCFNFAGAFTVLARGLGFPAFGVLRSLDKPDNMHAWTDIVIDGKAYIFDPQLEMHFKNDRFMLSYADGARYGYRRPDEGLPAEE